MPIPFSIDDRTLPFPSSISIRVTLMDLDSKAVFTVPIGDFQLENRKWGDTYKITFPGFDQWTQAGFFKNRILRKELLQTNLQSVAILFFYSDGKTTQKDMCSTSHWMSDNCCSSWRWSSVRFDILGRCCKTTGLCLGSLAIW